MFDSLFDDVTRIIEDWEPEDEYSNERDYGEDLISFLREELNKPSSFGLAPTEKVKVKSEAGRHLCDIGRGECRIGIELKKDLTKLGSIDRLEAQLRRFLRVFEDLIVVLVGVTTDEAVEEVEDRIRRIKEGSTGLTLDMESVPEIELIDKTKFEEDAEEREPSGLDW